MTDVAVLGEVIGVVLSLPLSSKPAVGVAGFAVVVDCVPAEVDPVLLGAVAPLVVVVGGEVPLLVFCWEELLLVVVAVVAVGAVVAFAGCSAPLGALDVAAPTFEPPGPTGTADSLSPHAAAIIQHHAPTLERKKRNMYDLSSV